MKARHFLIVSLLAASVLPALSAHAQVVRSIGIARNPAAAAAERAHGEWRQRNLSGGSGGAVSAAGTSTAEGANSNPANAGNADNRGGRNVGFVQLPGVR
ncbi:hypothetical protein BTH42_16385 [Burkholderia sp. SRS-W-2-2016]|uniref:hypothetical protein n=1 Tax=Burkholderia sp. SRS-W-2-2016 TaxID=1926878 RepID=UPI00094AB71F|nr:hypothetical protein [Burkholderia sp. SRS-W-2-2016]OLL30527.1 hypothetical protein BTH42_16385 [Burkholderia sp. SRS-W-2-2016]